MPVIMHHNIIIWRWRLIATVRCQPAQSVCGSVAAAARYQAAGAPIAGGRGLGVQQRPVDRHRAGRDLGRRRRCRGRSGREQRRRLRFILVRASAG